jgi:hypothetical protein
MAQLPAWSVTTQSEGMGIGANGLATRGVTVGFTTPDGTAGSVFVPESQYNADNVRALIVARVATLEAVKGLAP